MIDQSTDYSQFWTGVRCALFSRTDLPAKAGIHWPGTEVSVPVRTPVRTIRTGSVCPYSYSPVVASLRPPPV